MSDVSLAVSEAAFETVFNRIEPDAQLVLFDGRVVRQPARQRRRDRLDAQRLDRNRLQGQHQLRQDGTPLSIATR